MKDYLRPAFFKYPEVFIESMKVLITHYEGALENNCSKTEYANKKKAPCLLCNPIGIKIKQKDIFDRFFQKTYDDIAFSHRAACAELGCPWIVMTGGTCDDYDAVSSFSRPVYFSLNKKRIMNRIKQIREWVLAYEEELSSNNSYCPKYKPKLKRP